MAQNLLTPALDVFGQMALDETVAKQALSEPVLRFYHWTSGPAVTFGYAQFYDFVRRQTAPERGPLCRRPTGGGLVFHGADLTFSLIFPSDELRPSVLYARLHGAIETALAEAKLLHTHRQGKVAAQAYVPVQNGVASGCFINPVQDDLLLDGRKILGGAIRRLGPVVLYQGSLQYPGVRENPAFRHAVQKGLETALGVQFAVAPAPQACLKDAADLARTQYVSRAWTEKF